MRCPERLITLAQESVEILLVLNSQMKKD
jgi:hypothetical protein